MKNIFLLTLWIITVIFSIIWTFENPEKIEKIKSNFKKNKKISIEVVAENKKYFTANSFDVELSKILSLDTKTAFLIYPDQKKKFDKSNLTIFTQSGFIINNEKISKLNLPDYFTLQRNGGVKTIITLDNESFALISANERGCFFSSIVSLGAGEEVFRTSCLPENPKNNDFNGMGSSNIHFKESILFSLGTPEKHLSKNSLLAQDSNSFFGKILEIKKVDLKNISSNKSQNLKVNIFSQGHRVPQGLTVLNNKIFNTEHGPKGGDELNLVFQYKNYGWPYASYGTNYMEDNGGNGKSIPINHEKNNFEEPLFAFVPSVGISSLNNCPSALMNYYKKPCLIALSLYGNNLRKGHSLIIFLLNDSLDKVHSIEKISLDNLVLRHFVTNKKNILFEDDKGNIYVSADKEGVYKIRFTNFR
jgi:hypothetical protein